MTRRYTSRKQLQFARPHGLPCYYPLSKPGTVLIFCGEECRRTWVENHKQDGTCDRRAWRFITGVPECAWCNLPLWQKPQKEENMPGIYDLEDVADAAKLQAEIDRRNNLLSRGLCPYCGAVLETHTCKLTDPEQLKKYTPPAQR